MNFSEKLVILRKENGLSQENLAEKLNVSRQAVAKWENGFGFPDISNLISISEIFNVTLDYLVKENDCSVKIPFSEKGENKIEELIAFRLEANKNTYAGFANEVEPFRFDSHDFKYCKGDYAYYDTYLGGEQFAGEEAVFKCGKAIYAMNYLGRVLDERFSGNFLKECLRNADFSHPFRGLEYYKSGEYVYKNHTNGNINWFLGNEEIFCGETKVYECFYHGGLIR